MKTFLAILAGIAAIWLLSAGGEAIGNSMYPPRTAEIVAASQRMDLQAVRTIMADVPTGSLVLKMLVTLIAAFASVFVANKVNPASAKLNMYILGGLYLVGTGIGVLFVPYPIWMQIGSLAAVAIGVLLANRMTPAYVAPHESLEPGI